MYVISNAFSVLDFLLWASMCMETSVPLLGVRYLYWRSTLYTAVCQCYYDCKNGQHAEVGLLQIFLPPLQSNILEGLRLVFKVWKYKKQILS